MSVKVGDRLKCIKHVEFCDDTRHFVGDIVTVEQASLPYYRLHIETHYRKIGEVK